MAACTIQGHTKVLSVLIALGYRERLIKIQLTRATEQSTLSPALDVAVERLGRGTNHQQFPACRYDIVMIIVAENSTYIGFNRPVQMISDAMSTIARVKRTNGRS